MKTPCLLFLETAAKNCSVSLTCQEDIHTEVVFSEKYIHAETLHKLIKSCLNKAGISTEKIQGVIVNLGPGSYTGLRIGVSAAKGFAYALDVPIVGLNSMEIILEGTRRDTKLVSTDFILNTVDAGRMEVYMSLYNGKDDTMSPVEAKEISLHTFQNLIDKHTLLISGNASEKLKNFLSPHPNLFFDLEERLVSENMINLGIKKYDEKEFENLAYFEPYYLKNFKAGKSAKSLISS